MKTNRYRIPDEYAKMIVGEPREPRPLNRYSVTKLIGSVREGVLAETNEPDDDISDSFVAFIGTCVHYYMEKHTGGENELKLEAEIGGNVVSGIIDHYEDGTITDYKTRKCRDDDFSDAVKQIKIYAWLLRKNGIVARKGKIVAIRRDWSKLRDPDESPIEEIEFPIGSDDIERAERYVGSRIAEFEKARVSLPECSDEERWKQPDKWAVYAHEGDAKAKKLFATEEEAKAFAGEKMIVEYRKGKNLKCENFCPYRRVCSRSPIDGGSR